MNLMNVILSDASAVYNNKATSFLSLCNFRKQLTQDYVSKKENFEVL